MVCAPDPAIGLAASHAVGANSTVVGREIAVVDCEQLGEILALCAVFYDLLARRFLSLCAPPLTHSPSSSIGEFSMRPATRRRGSLRGSIAQGSVFAIFGRNFGPTQPAQVSAFPLGTTFQGVGVSVCQSGSCIPAIPLFVSAGQINVIMPSDAPLGPVSVRVIFNGQGGYYASATVVASSFGIAAVNGEGFGYGSIQNLAPDGSPVSPLVNGGVIGPRGIQNLPPEGAPVNSAVNSAKPGQTVALWGTGLGAGLNADNLEPQTGDLPVDVEIWVGGRKVTNKRYSGRSSCCAGIDLIVFDLPDDTPAGCYVPIQVRTGGVVSNSVSIAVSADGAACSDSSNPLSQLIRTGGNLGLILANRVNALMNFIKSEPEETVEFAVASFRRENGGPFAYNALASLPPPGSCTVHTVPGDFLTGDVIPAFRSTGGELDAGSTLTMGTLTFGKSIYYTGTLAGTPAGFRKRNVPVSALGEPLTVRGTGGADVGPFTANLSPAPAIHWSDRDQGQAVNRSGGFIVNWSGGEGPGAVLVAGISSNTAGNASAVFLCTASPGTNSFPVPSYIVQGLPPSAERVPLGVRFGYAMVGFLPVSEAGAFSASGVDSLTALVASWSARAVVYQ